ncbi:MAG: glycosyltransferase family 2 protein [Candidatus Pacebacteria bacterium]|nr:glycosyltransferase family 2 protein [Candidatus Paceibacterota bacterium]MBP9701300.1 glycosyltransferase family 2 protein [Candidatus Paceibacterota bacterium]
MNFAEIATYAITFLALYVQVFLFVTYIEKRKTLKKEEADPVILTRYPTVAIVVPCWNEGTTVHGTIESLLALEYPKDKLQVIAVDDGSTDRTWDEILKYKDHPQVQILKKENGGKHTAVNYGIDNTTTEFISCLDADSFVAPDALKRTMNMFEKNPDMMAIAPSIIIFKPKTFIQKIQKVEYNMGIYVKKMLAYLGAIHVTPGPFSVFRRSVFQQIGGFRKAHNTEDMEIAYRMQEAHLRIGHCHTAHIFTVAPSTIPKLFKQRVRWIYGFIQNTIDYRRLIFRKHYGNFSFFTLPSGIVSITATVYIFFTIFYNVIVWIIEKIAQLRTVGFHTGTLTINLDWFYINTQTILFITVALYGIIALVTVIGSRMAHERLNFAYLIWYILVYSAIAPFWLMKAVWSSLTKHKPSWR